MSKIEVGDRIGAILAGDADNIYFLGYGVYEGMEVPPQDSIGPAKIVAENNAPNPKLKLDNGDIVWGCECWWGSEENIAAMLKKRIQTIIEVDIKEEREKVRQAWETSGDDDFRNASRQACARNNKIA